jgi:regulator of sigma E protease
MEFFESIWWLLVLIGVMIIVHELGHYWAARFFDVKVEAFSFGFGPRLFGFRKGETDFRFSLILLGGYVKMAGEQLGEEGALDPRSLLAKPRWQRMIIAFAGPAMNIVLSVGILTGLFMVHYEKTPLKGSPVIGYVAPDSQAAKAGILVGDRIVRVDGIENPNFRDFMLREISDTNATMALTVERDGRRIDNNIPLPASDKTENIGSTGIWDEREVMISEFPKGPSAARDAGLQVGDILKTANGVPVRYLNRTSAENSLNRAVAASGGKPVEIVYSRKGVEHTVQVTPKWTHAEALTGQTAAAPNQQTAPPVERWMIGIQMSEAVEVVQLAFPDALRESVSRNAEHAGLIYRYLEGMMERRFSPKSMSGPIGIAGLARKAAKLGPLVFFDLMTMVSLNLAIFNLLPIPILDGGVILMLLIEMIRRQDLSLQLKEAVFKVGFAFLMMVVVFVIYNDISKQRAESVVPPPPPPPVQQQQQPVPVPPPGALIPAKP